MSSLTRRLFRTEHDLAQEDLSAYLDNELAAKDRARVERHLRACPACRAELETLRRTVDLLHLLPEVSLPRSFLVPVTEGRLATAQQRPPAFAAMRLASVMATFLFVIALSGRLWLQLEPRQAAFAPAPQAIEQPVTVMETVVVEKEVAVAREVEAVQVAAAPQAAVTEETMMKAAGAEDVTTPPSGEAAPATAETALLSREAPRIMAEAPSTPQAEMVSLARAETTPEPAATSEPVSAKAVSEPTAAAVLALKAADTPAATADGAAGSAASTYGVGDDLERGTARRNELLRPILEGLMWVLLVATVALWAGTAMLSKRRRG